MCVSEFPVCVRKSICENESKTIKINCEPSEGEREAKKESENESRQNDYDANRT